MAFATATSRTGSRQYWKAMGLRNASWMLEATINCSPRNDAADQASVMAMTVRTTRLNAAPCCLTAATTATATMLRCVAARKLESAADGMVKRMGVSAATANISANVAQ